MTEFDVRDEIVRLIKLKSIPTHRLSYIMPDGFDFVKVYNRRVRPLDGDVPFDATGLAHIYKNVVITPSSIPAIISVSASGLGNRMLEATTSSGKHSLGLDRYR